MDEEGGEDFASLSNIYYRMAKAYDYDKATAKNFRSRLSGSSSCMKR
jgi:hypothetical protein